MNILDRIIATKRLEVADAKLQRPLNLLEKSEYFRRVPLSLVKAIKKPGSTGIIAEIKRRSPSKGLLNPDVSIERTSTGYVSAGAAALSILTDHEYFGGTNADLQAARGLNACPILRKDFTIDEYQIVEAKSIGADAILLIAAALPPELAAALARFAHSLELEVLLEVHDEQELVACSGVEADLIGVNNRNLKTFEVSVETSRRLAPMIPKRSVKVSESGITEPAIIHDLRKIGYSGFLIGETFMRSPQPEEAARQFTAKLASYGKAEA
jgi:indole-3-glycerol phosphate synthase